METLRLPAESSTVTFTHTKKLCWSELSCLEAARASLSSCGQSQSHPRETVIDKILKSSSEVSLLSTTQRRAY